MAQQEPPPPPLALIHKTTQHLRRQRYLNVLGFFLPLGLALGLSGYLCPDNTVLAARPAAGSPRGVGFLLLDVPTANPKQRRTPNRGRAAG